MHALTDRRRLAVVSVFTLFMTGVATWAPQVALASPIPAPSAPAAGAAAAAALAARTGRPVEVLGDRTDWSQTFAQPGGGFSTVESVVPQRVRRSDGSWTPVNTTLARRADGSVAPTAITTGLVLSGGGAGPLYTLTENGAAMAVYWPDGPLPVPTLSGATATYPAVLPGVNLLLSATPRGVSELVEVTDAAAAANPALARLTFRTALTGLSLSRDMVGDLTASGPNGQAVFAAPPPQMWDSSGLLAAGAATPAGFAARAAGAAVQARGPAPGDHFAKMAVTTGARSLTLAPDRRVLSGARVTYPVFIDPEWDGQESTGVTWLDVWKDRAGDVSGDWEPQNSTYGGIRSGVYCNYSTNGVCDPYQGDTNWGIYRSYLNFPISKASGLASADFIDAQLSINESWSWTCSVKTTVDLYRTDKADQGITWNSQPAQHVLSDSKDIAYGDTCPAHGVTFDAKPALSQVQTGSNLTLELRATGTDESNWNVDSWKRFTADSIDLIVYWRHAPDKPTNVAVRGAFDAATGKTVNGCSTSSTSPDYVNVTNPTWQATIDDADGTAGGNIDGEFSWHNLSNGNTGTLGAAQNAAQPGTTFTGARSGGGGDLYQWSAYGQTPSVTDADGNTVPVLKGPSSASCYFQIDTNAPTIAPTITSVPDASGRTYTSGVATNPVGSPAVFQLSDPTNADPSDGVNDIVGFKYGINSAAPTVYVPAGSMGGTATITVTPFNPAALNLYVQAVDRAGNVSQVAGPFEIETVLPPGGIATLAWWRLNAGSGTVAVDATGDGADATLSSSGATLGCDSSAGPSGYKCTLSLDGTGGRAYTANPVVGNNGSFTVSTWAKASSCSGTCVVLSQGGSTVSGFTLGYKSSCTSGTATGPCWEFSMPASDASGAVVQSVQSAPGSAKAGTWTQVTGVYDATHEQLLLYLNGGDGVTAGDGVAAAASAPLSVLPWSAPAAGVFRFGADWTSAAGTGDYFNGELSAACAFYGPLGSSDIQTLYAGGAGDGCSALFTQYP